MFMLPKGGPCIKVDHGTGLVRSIPTPYALDVVPVAIKLLEHRSAIYSSRQRLYMASELAYRGQGCLSCTTAVTTAASTYERLQSFESARRVEDILQTLDCSLNHARRVAGSTIMQVAYGRISFIDRLSSDSGTEAKATISSSTMVHFRHEVEVHVNTWHSQF
ncbi:BZ3500_MvSof-1268-A1-R1_Chr1-3g01684 [Microbotryum saponariae]|uniref:BZ3500_MvSof-1268-A1-R1_Chr1-3g01684 protein n=1 Tax=Microbotryum saponariae TaxID=289078 RepID=A0A2X0MPI1_9BASI|nr:BZ3500_MvSof-1268-A1-R1_Chr1-3g01684 [Microbotryum saponariae]SCZ94314.1 BZ3501_MvSof-1269-A2-R1_Chr1-3g01285 [Microbotryum saponariae]